MSTKNLVPIQLPADPTSALEAATKQYVDGMALNTTWSGTQAEFDALSTLDTNKHYYVVP